MNTGMGMHKQNPNYMTAFVHVHVHGHVSQVAARFAIGTFVHPGFRSLFGGRLPGGDWEGKGTLAHSSLPIVWGGIFTY